MLVGRLRIFVEDAPDLLLTPNTELSIVDLSRVEYVLADPGVPRGQSLRSRTRRFMSLLSIVNDIAQAKRALIVMPDVWEPKTNIKLFRYGLGLLKAVKLRVDYVPVLYIHGYHSNRSMYDPILRSMDVVVGVPTRFNTLSYPNVVECRRDVGKCANDIAFALSTFDRIHFGGPSLAMLKTISSVLNSPFTNTKERYEWLSADTMVYRWSHSKELPMRILTRPEAHKYNHQYIVAFLNKISNLKF